MCIRDRLTLGLPDHDVYLVHTAEDVGWVPAADLPRLTAQGKEEFSALLDAKVTAIRPGPYGVELVPVSYTHLRRNTEVILRRCGTALPE